MNLYVQLTEEEYEQFKTFKKKPSLEDYDSAALTAGLLSVIKKEGGQVETQDNRFDFDPNARKTTTVAKLKNSNFITTVIVERY